MKGTYWYPPSASVSETDLSSHAPTASFADRPIQTLDQERLGRTGFATEFEEVVAGNPGFREISGQFFLSGLNDTDRPFQIRFESSVCFQENCLRPAGFEKAWHIR
jgi:hypothetical protein